MGVLGSSIIAISLMGLTAGVGGGGGGAPKEKKVTVEGKLDHPVYALGGETTGTVVQTKTGGAYELDLKGNKDLLKQVEALKGKEIKVTGPVKVVKGLEVPERKIITVQEIMEVKR